MHSKGFSLIELVIAMAILAIVVTVAISGYSSQVIKTRRTDGTAALLEIMAK